MIHHIDAETFARDGYFVEEALLDERSLAALKSAAAAFGAAQPERSAWS